MDVQIEELWDEYDELTEAVEGSGYQLFAHNLKRWFAFLDSTAPIAGVVLRLENLSSFAPWYENCQRTMGSMAGSGLLQWPDDVVQEL